MALGLFQSLLSEALNSDEADNSQAAAQEAAKRAQQEAWMKAEHQRLNNMVNQQRVTRDGEDKAGMDEMAKAMGSGFDTPMPKSDLASALSDPNVVDLRGKKGIVDPNVLKQFDPEKPKLKTKRPLASVLQELDKSMAEKLKQLKEDQDKLSKALDNYSGPPVAAQTYKSVHFMGLLNSQEDADKAFNKHFRNFNDGLPYEKIVAFGQHGVLKELFRGGLDREAAQLSLLSPMTLEKCHSLKGAVIDDLVVHSNAATVTEVLIKRGDIKVTNLSILGGDRSLANLAGWEKLISTGKVKEITIYVNKGDPVPWLPQVKDLDTLGVINYAGRMSKSLSHQGLVNVVFFNKKPYECASDITLSASAAEDYHLDEVYHYNGMKYKGTDKIISKQR